MKSNKTHIIINPHSGTRTKEGLEDLIQETLKEDSNELVFQQTGFPGHGKELAQKAIQESAKTVVVVGGDGSVNEVGTQLIGSNIPLGIIPCGSGNGIARHLKIPLGPKEALKSILHGQARSIDTGTLNNIPFIGFAGIGFDALVAQRFDQQRRRGFLAYALTSSQAFLHYHSKVYTVYLDGAEKEFFRAFFLGFANGSQYGNGFCIAPDASMKDGRLNLLVIHPFPFPSAPFLLPRFFMKSINKSPIYESRTFKTLETECTARCAHIDGEPVEIEEKVKVEVVPESLKVIL